MSLSDINRYRIQSHTHQASDITIGKFDISNIPTGTSANTVALGNHTHPNISTDSLDGIVNKNNLPDDIVYKDEVDLTVITWNDIQNKPLSYTPSEHTHTVNSISASGTPSSNTYLRGDGTWASIESGDGAVYKPGDGIIFDASAVSGENTEITISVDNSITVSEILNSDPETSETGTLNSTGNIGSEINYFNNLYINDIHGCGWSNPCLGTQDHPFQYAYVNYIEPQEEPSNPHIDPYIGTPSKPFDKIYANTLITKDIERSDVNSDIGTTDKPFSNLYIKTGHFEALMITSDRVSPRFSSDIVDLGTSTRQFNDLYVSNSPTVVSDEREKNIITDSPMEGLDFISKLNPIKYKWKVSDNTKIELNEDEIEYVHTGEFEEVYTEESVTEEYEEFDIEKNTFVIKTKTVINKIPVKETYDILDESGNVIRTEERNKLQPVMVPKETIRVEPIAGSRIHYGLSAQQVKSVMDELGIDDYGFGGWVLADKNDPNSKQAIRYEQFIAPLIQSIKELKEEIDQLKLQISSQE